MKKIFIFSFFSVLFLFFMITCSKHGSGSESFRIGSRGPAGGYVFYDCDADNESGNADGLKSSECGWRYLEAAPEDLLVECVWGDDGFFGTKDGIGEGKNNTDIIVKYASKDRPNNAATVCRNYSQGGYSDWFLPSTDELMKLTNKKISKRIGNMKYMYWTSTEADYRQAVKGYQSGDYGLVSPSERGGDLAIAVHPIRAFK